MRYRLAAGSRALETGGYKRRGRAIPKGELRRMMTRWLGIPESHILGEYGMSELSSQAYDRVLPEGRILAQLPLGGTNPSPWPSPRFAGRGNCQVAWWSQQDAPLPETGVGFRFPPWARARIISPETGREAAEGETGMVQVIDLANVRSALAVQTEDLAVRRGEGFELTGRAAGAAARGCSLLLE
jgi:hypothetical protein